jgi:hypothetical protein
MNFMHAMKEMWAHGASSAPRASLAHEQVS